MRVRPYLPHSFILSALSRIQPAFCLWKGCIPVGTALVEWSGFPAYVARETAGLRKGIRSCAKLFWHLPLL
ncbi:hypothetical protein AGR5A_Cc70341 [Agrobacterium genomosp. 5 str. CFBP 6626]|nr:hypothetical protein AGR5A_Cc70341 [Agrobacterium genomosp. 5 str. CFBP 6626]